MYQVMKSKVKKNNQIEKDTRRIDIKKFFSLKSIIIYMLSILVGMCKLSSGATPFGLALLGAIADVKFPLIVPMVLIALSTGATFGGICALKFIIASLVFILLKSFVKENSKTGNGAKILFATAISEIIVLSAQMTLIYDGIMAAFMSTTTAIFYFIFSEGLDVILHLRNKRIDSHETLMAFGILITVAMTALGDLSIFSLSVRTMISVLVVMLLGWLRGMSVGITTGLSISLVLGLMGLADASMVATYVVCGLLSGFLSRYGKVGAIIGFILGNAIWVFCINASTSVIIPIGEILVSALLLLFMPNKISFMVDDIFESKDVLDGRDPIALLAENTIFKLKAVSDVANDMAQNVEKKENDSNASVTDFIKTLTAHSCCNCANYEKCWQQGYHFMYETVFNSLEILSREAKITEKDLETDICVDKARLVSGLNYSYELYKVNNEWKNKLNENCKLMANQLRGVSKAVDSAKKEMEMLGDLPELGSANFKLEVGIAKAKKSGSSISGDSTIFTRLADYGILIGISDGMGSGEIASEISKKTLELYEKYLNTGLTKEEALGMMNSYLMLGNHSDCYATLDCVMYDEVHSNAEFIKYGASPSYIKSGDRIEKIISNTLPIGTNGFAYEKGQVKVLARGDMIVIVSDGILDATSKSKNWLEELLLSIKNSNPKRMADIILQEAVDANYGIANDDMTVIVAKIC